MNSGKVEKRHTAILDMLANGQTVSVPELCERFQCCTSTVRNDLAALERQGCLRRIFNGAVAKQEADPYSVPERANSCREQKREIARYVVDTLLTPHSTIILDAGTTAAEVAYALRERNFPISVLTSSFLAASALVGASNVKLFSFGGFFNRERYAFDDDLFHEYAKRMHADLFFMGVNGVSAEAGFSIAYFEEVHVKTMYLRIASRTVALCDSSKIARNASRIIADFQTVGTLVTDSGAKAGQVEALRAAGLEVLMPSGKSGGSRE